MNTCTTCCNPHVTPDCDSVEMSNLQRCNGVTMHGCGNPAYNVYCWDHAHPVCHKPEPVAIQHLCAYLRKDEAAHIYTTKQETFDLQTIISNTYQTKEDAAAEDQKLDQEIADRVEGDTRLEGEIQAQSVILEGIIQAEVNRAKAAEQTLQNNIDQEVSRAQTAEQNLSNAITAEATRATNRENELQQAINAETQRATTKEASLEQAINTEKTRATNKEAELQNNIDTETSRAQHAESDLQTNITAEKNRAQAAESALNTAVQANTSAIANEVSRAQTAENNLSAALASLNNTVITDLVHSADYNTTTKQIEFKNSEGTIIDSIDASAFIKDGMVNNVQIINGVLKITFNTDAGKQDIDIPISSIFDANNYYTKAEIDSTVQTLNNSIAQKADAATLTQNYYTKDVCDSKYVAQTSMTNYYTKAQVDQLVADAINNALANYYTKSQADAKYAAA